MLCSIILADLTGISIGIRVLISDTVNFELSSVTKVMSCALWVAG